MDRPPYLQRKDYELMQRQKLDEAWSYQASRNRPHCVGPSRAYSGTLFAHWSPQAQPHAGGQPHNGFDTQVQITIHELVEDQDRGDRWRWMVC